MREKIITALASAAAVAVFGWTGQALTLNGRVTAMEASLARIEARLDRQSPKP